VTAPDFPDTLIALERAAWEELQAGQLTVPTATAVHAAVTQYAAEAGIDRYTVEMGLKKAVRHAEG
jgi:hypothetical protein